MPFLINQGKIHCVQYWAQRKTYWGGGIQAWQKKRNALVGAFSAEPGYT